MVFVLTQFTREVDLLRPCTDSLACQVGEISVSQLGTQMVPFDELVEVVLSEWQDYNDVRMVQDSVALEDLFRETDDNGNGMLDYNEFHGLVTRRSPGIEDEVVMNMFDNGIQLASEQVCEGGLRGW